MTTTHTPGQVAYTAYRQRFLTYPHHTHGTVMPEAWEELPLLTQICWETAADAAQGDALPPARAVVQHWHEFGPEYGFDEAVHALDRWLKRPER